MDSEMTPGQTALMRSALGISMADAITNELIAPFSSPYGITVQHTGGKCKGTAIRNESASDQYQGYLPHKLVFQADLIVLGLHVIEWGEFDRPGCRHQGIERADLFKRRTDGRP